MITTDVENFPGYPEILGPDLILKIEEQATKSGAEMRFDTVMEVDFSSRPFKLRMNNNKPLLADAVIIATGARARYLGLPSEERLMNKGVSACATCDGPLFRGKEVAVVGGGDSAAEEALFLTRLCPKVHLIHRRDVLRASKVMRDRVAANEKIVMHWNSEVDSVEGKDFVDGLVLKSTKDGSKTKVDVGGLFVAIGHVPQTGLFKGWLTLDSQGYIQNTPGSTYTNIAGVFVAGDASDHVYRQAITAAGTGCAAAIDAERWLAENPSPSL